MELQDLKRHEYRLKLTDTFSFPDCLRVNDEARSVLKVGERLVIDFSACTYIDSSGLGVLFSLRRNLPSESKLLSLINIRPEVMQIITAFKLNTLFDIHCLD